MMMDSSPSKLNMLPQLPQVAGVKRPAPTLLPAFEPLSSSPGFPRPSKRQARYSPSREIFAKYPTPVPTSTTGILSSSPPRVHGRPNMQRTVSSVSERAPLAAVPTVVLPGNGEPLLMGRSSNSSHYQLSGNRLISRVHVKARYIAAPTPLESNKVEIVCMGWNGIKIHCYGNSWDLAKGDSFTSRTESAEIMLDVQDARVIIAWPSRGREASESASSWDDESSPRRRVDIQALRAQALQSSPLRMGQRLTSPESPTPAGHGASRSTLFADSHNAATVQVYEDESSDQDAAAKKEDPEDQADVLSEHSDHSVSQSSELSEPANDPDEENDPIIHSFGPFGDNISSRMAAFTATGSPEPEEPRGGASESSSALSSPSPAKRSESESTNTAEPLPVINHVVNQLAFSRLSSTPLSVILNHLPAELRGISSSHPENRGLIKEDLQRMLVATPCIGEIHREGKDAAGKPLESEYYYIPDEDVDEVRRAAVVDGLRKPSLRNCRKSHKQYYWKKPRTP